MGVAAVGREVESLYGKIHVRFDLLPKTVATAV